MGHWALGIGEQFLYCQTIKLFLIFEFERGGIILKSFNFDEKYTCWVRKV